MSTYRISLLASCVLLAAGALRAELPSPAQSALRKGVLAGQQQDYPLALRYFEEARRAAPDAAEIYFNLGLTESKIPGRELRAMAWFGAYLTASPDAPNAAAIREQLDVLEVKAAGATARLLQTTEEAAGKLPAEPDGFGSRWQKLEYIASLWADQGDLASARRIAALLKGREAHRQAVLVSIAAAQAKTGDGDAARKTLDSVRLGELGHWDAIAAARIHTKLGNTAGARKALDQAARVVDRMSSANEGEGLIAPWARRGEQHQQVVEAQIEAGHHLGAEKTLEQLERNPRSDSYRLPGLAWVALGYAKGGNDATAKKLFRRAQELVATVFTEARLKDYYFGRSEKSRALVAIAEAQARLGDRAAAATTLAAAREVAIGDPDDYFRCNGVLEVAALQARWGESAAARETMATAMAGSGSGKNTWHKLWPQRKAILEKLGLHPTPADTTAEWLACLADDEEYGNCPLNAAPFLDLAAHLQSLPANNADGILEGMYTAARQMVAAQGTIHDLLANR